MPWATPTANQPVDTTVPVPGSKSMTARALLLAAISMGPSTLQFPSESRDSVVLARGLRAMGCHVSSADDEQWLLRPRPLAGPVRVDTELSGAATRFLPPLAGLASGPISFDGDPVLRQARLEPQLAAMSSLGIRVDSATGGLPLTVHGVGHVPGGAVSLDSSASSQMVSGLLLVGADFDQGLRVRHEGPPLAGTPHVELTVTMLRAAGAAIDASVPDSWELRPGRLTGRAWTIEPDLVAAAPFLAAAMVTGGTVRVPRWPTRAAQPTAALQEALTGFGARCTHTTDGLVVAGCDKPHGADVDVARLGELVPVLAAIAALADAPSYLRGVRRLAGEPDLVSGVCAGLAALGGAVEEAPDGLRITPRPLHGGVFDTRGDHRLAYAGAVLGLAVPGVQLSDVGTTAKSLPGFPSRWHRMLAG
ncbi:3-phosphoshikimate 1-carboxyvinyltransferase [Actinocatenispora comari]|uniref:3-phosphoshikimate 1-carboxyvinyltransferase n=1 Tax=Actinocatenispora comari TaxID=2807577 RepID=A0A8J4ELE8_9ACTN|nr:3-phosphoshikimate 1-carboxyvinyltransferase [Actinocatenispora comari]GIL28431.1 3-phosphoshikimate 1-carboxyvinyltransferase 1 [Actinocatenispora comari]